jgi:hypothetical protein
MNKSMFIKNKKLVRNKLALLLCIMKRITVILLFFVGLGFQSCQSEYTERMKKAIELKRKHTELRNIMNQSENQLIKTLLSELEREITIQAKISGNEELFLKELWKN